MTVWACMYVCTQHVYSTHRGKRGCQILELKLQMVVRHYGWFCELNPLGSPEEKAASVLDCPAISPALETLLF